MKKLASILLIPAYLMGVSQLLDIRAQGIPANGAESTIELNSIDDGLLPDVAVRNLRYLNADDPAQVIADPIRGDRVVPSFMIENTGEITADPFYITIENMTVAVGGNPDGTLQFASSAIFVDNLTAGEERNVRPMGDFILNSQNGKHTWRVTVDPYQTLTEHSEADNIREFETPITGNDWRNPAKDYIALKPRMTPENIVRNGANEVNRNGEFTLETKIVNHDFMNGIDAERDSVDVSLRINDREVRRENIVLSNGIGTLRHTIRGGDFALGEYSVSVMTDPDNVIEESNERNNTIAGNNIRVMATGAAAAGGIQLPDITISNVTYELYNQRGVQLDGTDLRRGDIFYPMVTVRNNGNASTDEIFYVDVEDRTRIVGISNRGEPIYSVSGIMFSELSAGAEATATTVSPFILNQRTGAADTMTLRMKADPYEYNAELNESNNIYNADIRYERVGFQPITHDYLPYSLRRIPDNVVLQGGVWEINQNDSIRLTLKLNDNDFVDRGFLTTVENVPVQVRAGNVTRNIEVDFDDSMENIEVNFTGRELGLGEHPVVVNIDPSGIFAETNRRNNIREFHTIRVVERNAYEYEAMEMPELSIENITLKRLGGNGWTDIEPEELERGDRFQPFITIQNTGTANSGLFYVVVEDHSRWMTDPITRRLVPFESGIMYDDIAPGESVTETTVSPFLIDNTGSGDFTLRFRVDGYERVLEINESNNFHAYSIPREDVPFNVPSFDFLAESLRRTPDNVVYQDRSWHIKDTETLTLALNLRNNDYVDANHLDHTVNNLIADVRIGRITKRLTFNIPDWESSSTINFDVTGRELGIGRHEVEVIVDPLNSFAETNERNNTSLNLFKDILVEAAPIAPNLRPTSARLVHIDGDRYYPVITILNDSDIPVETYFNNIIHNKASFVGYNEDRTPRYTKASVGVNRLDAHASMELTADRLIVTADERSLAADIWVQLDRTGFGTFDDVEESNETDNEGFYNLGEMVEIDEPAAEAPAVTKEKNPDKDAKKKRLNNIKEANEKTLSKYRANLRQKGVKIPAEKNKDLVEKKSPAHKGASDQKAKTTPIKKFTPKVKSKITPRVVPNLRLNRIKLQSTGNMEEFNGSLLDFLKISILNVFR